MIGAMTDQSSPFTGFPVSPVYDGMTSTAVRDLLDVLSVPGVISFAGGAPAAESFEIDDVRECFDWVFANRGAKALQYSSTPGEPELREQAARRVSRTLPTSADQIQITTGSQEAIYLVGHAMLRPGDIVLVERPTYLAAVQAFASSGARLIGIPSDDDGAQPEALEELIREHDPRFVYLIPTFQNPSGVSMPAQRRREIAEVLLRTGAPLVEDDPYGELRFEGETAPQIAALPGMARQTLLLNSMSKIMSPGIRVGWRWPATSSTTTSTATWPRSPRCTGVVAMRWPPRCRRSSRRAPRSPGRRAGCSCGPRSATGSTPPRCCPWLCRRASRSCPGRRSSPMTRTARPCGCLT
jgi:2-aminoadipate transaminase